MVMETPRIGGVRDAVLYTSKLAAMRVIECAPESRQIDQRRLYGKAEVGILGPRQNSYRSVICASQAMILHRYQQKYQQAHRRRLDQSKGAPCANRVVPPGEKISGDLEISTHFGL